MLNQANDFFLKGNVAFNDRQKSVFGSLDALTPESTKQRYTKEEFQKANSKTTVDTIKKDMKQFRGQESIFKRPELPLKRSFKMALPDFLKNPHKWKKYKMSDDVMTEESNTAAAMAFLKEMKERTEPMETNQSSGPILFNKYAVKDEGEKLAIEEKSKSVFLNSKTVMPEYVVGQKKKKSVSFKNIEPAEAPTQTVMLQHLFEDE